MNGTGIWVRASFPGVSPRKPVALTLLSLLGCGLGGCGGGAGVGKSTVSVPSGGGGTSTTTTGGTANSLGVIGSSVVASAPRSTGLAQLVFIPDITSVVPGDRSANIGTPVALNQNFADPPGSQASVSIHKTVNHPETPAPCRSNSRSAGVAMVWSQAASLGSMTRFQTGGTSEAMIIVR